MAIRFILGKSGTGKSTLCIEQICSDLQVDSAHPLVLLVPEQASYLSERAVLERLEVKGYHRLNVLSFNRLEALLTGGKAMAAGAVFGDGRVPVVELDALGRELVVYKLINRYRERLKVFARAGANPGLCAKIASTIIEFHEYDHDPDEVAALAEGMMNANQRQGEGKTVASAAVSGGYTAYKMADLAFLYKKYVEFIEDKFINPDSRLTEACAQVRHSQMFKGARVWVDGFAGFTGQQVNMLAEIFKAAGEVNIALCMDPAEVDLKQHKVRQENRLGLFDCTERTFGQLVELAGRLKIKLDEPVVLKEVHRFKESPALAHIEKNIFQNLKAAKIAADDSLEMAACANPRAEVIYAARKILQLVGNNGFSGGYRFRDIAVIAPELGSYRAYIESIFREYGIPYFIDMRRPLSSCPAVELICSALRAASGDFGTSDVIGYLKTGLGPLNEGEVDVLENYCLAYGIDGGQWIEGGDWEYAGGGGRKFDDGAVDEIRRRAVQPLVELRDALYGQGVEGSEGQGGVGEKVGGDKGGGITARQFAGAVDGFIETLGVRGMLTGEGGDGQGGDKVGAMDDASRLDRLEIYGRFFDHIGNLFAQLDGVFADDEAVEVDEIVAVFISALMEMTMAFVPPAIDEVLVGSIERSRHPNLKAAILIGTTAGSFPVPVKRDSILNDRDRELADSLEFELAPGGQMQLIDRQYLCYIAFTRGSEKLVISYPFVDESKRAVLPSQFLNNLEFLFDGLEVNFAGVVDDIDDVLTMGELSDHLAGAVSPDSAVDEASMFRAAGFVKLLESDGQFCEAVKPVVAGGRYENKAVLGAEQAARLLGDTKEFSASRLSMFNKCPYRHFASYLLGLESKDTFDFEPMDIGDFYHKVLQKLFYKLSDRGKVFGEVDEGELQGLVAEAINEHISSDGFLSAFKGRCRHNGYVIDTAGEQLADAVKDFNEMARAGNFRQAAAELWFDGKKDSGLECKLKTAGGREFYLRGCIDRLDVCEDGGGNSAVIFDYKKSGKSFSWSWFYYGLDLQLPIYILAAAGGSVGGKSIAKVAGAFFLPVEAGAVKVSLGDIEKVSSKFARKASGLFEDSFAQKLEREANPRWARYYSFFNKSDGTCIGNYGKSSVLKRGDYEGTVSYAREVIAGTVDDIFSGRIDVRPFRLGGKSPCSYCEYRSLCRFDWQVNDYNLLSSLEKQEVLDLICEGGAGDE